MRDSLVSINIIYPNNGHNELLNKTGFPILFYYNGESDLLQAIRENDNFNKYIEPLCFNDAYYSFSSLKYFYFTYNGESEEQYTENTIDVQDLFLLENLEEYQSLFSHQYIYKIFEELYKNALHKEYDSKNKLVMIDQYDHIRTMYEEIQKKFPNKFIKETVINYLRGELKTRYNLNSKNISWILNQFAEKISSE